MITPKRLHPNLGKAPSGMTPTGIDFLDRLLGGGQEPGRSYGLLGPMGGFKSTLGLQIAISSARVLARRGPTQSPLPWVVADFENSADDLYPRGMSCASGQSREAAKSVIAAHRQLIRSNTLPTGRRPAGNDLVLPDWYTEALTFITERLVVLIDATLGFDPCPGEALDRKILRETDGHIAGLVVDHSTMVATGCVPDDCLVSPGGINAWNSQRIATFVARCSEMAKTYHCPVWVLHQLTSAGNTRGVLAELHHTDSRACRRFADTLDVVLALGVADARSKCLLLQCTKTHRPADVKAVLVQLDGEVAQLRAVRDDEYRIDPVRQRIVRPT